MIEQTDFSVLVEKAMAISNRSHMRPVIEKELLHYDILFALDKENLLKHLTFQGGTCLRLCYGSPRFSEDLDFAGGSDFTSDKLADIKQCIEHYIGKRYQLEVAVKDPAMMKDLPEYEGIKIDKWQVSIITSPKRKDLPRQRIKLEVANIPSYSRVPQSLKVNYDFLPDGYEDTLILSESLEEVMADKLISLVNTIRYIRNRDIWDLRWLKQQGAVVNLNWVRQKAKDYQIDDYLVKLDTMFQRLPDIVHGQAFKDEMVRFIPLDVQQRTLQKEGFYEFLINETRGLLSDVKTGWTDSGSNSKFTM